jgi:hypothetical protein
MADPKLTLNAFQPKNVVQLRPSMTGSPIKVGGAARSSSVLNSDDDEDTASPFAQVLSRVSQGSPSSAQLEQDDIEDVEDDE